MAQETIIKEWSVGKGIAVGLKWIAIMGIIITIFAFAQFVMKLNVGYYDQEACESRQIVGDSCGTVTPEYRNECCERQSGPGFYWDDNECVFNGT